MSPKRDYLLLALILILVVYVTYWVGYSNYKYYTFQAHWFDVGEEDIAFYYHLAFLSSTRGLQFVSFAEHIDPFEILLLPFYAIYSNPLTLFFIQDISFAAAALVIYYIGKNVVKNRYVGFALAIAFLINPGIRGATLYDFHPEAFIPLFYVLCFYFYMQRKKILFGLSYVLLLSIIETAVAVGAALLVGLLIYELVESRKNKDKKETKSKIYLIFICILITIAFGAFYLWSIHTLQASYQSGGYSEMPPFLKVANFYSSQFKTIFSPPPLGNSISPQNFVLLAIVGIIILVFGFGIYSLKVPIILLILISPWLVEVLLLHNWVFATLSNEYYTYAVGGAVVAAFLGIIKLSEQKNPKPIKLFPILLLAVLIAAYTTILTPINNLNNPIAWVNQHNSTSTDLNSAISMLNKNSTVMAQETIAAHMYQFRNIEMTPDFRLPAFTQNGYTLTNVTFYWFKPQYIIFDKNVSDYYIMNNSQFDIYTYMGSNYALYYSYNGIEIYKQKQVSNN